MFKDVLVETLLANSESDQLNHAIKEWKIESFWRSNKKTRIDMGDSKIRREIFVVRNPYTEVHGFLSRSNVQILKQYIERGISLRAAFDAFDRGELNDAILDLARFDDHIKQFEYNIGKCRKKYGVSKDQKKYYETMKKYKFSKYRFDEKRTKVINNSFR